MELLLISHMLVIYPEFFCATCRKNYALDQKMISPFKMVSTSSITMQVWGNRTRGAGCSRENMVFVCFSVFLSPSETVCSSFEGCIVRKSIVSRYMGQF